MSTNTDWFTTTPAAALRAEGIMHAFRERRIEDIGDMLSMDYLDAEANNPLHLLVALISIADRLGDCAAQLIEQGESTEDTAGRDTTIAALTREAARVVAEAAHDIHDDQEDANDE
ncbi:hypothetical protein [Nesterenkonia suensis]